MSGTTRGRYRRSVLYTVSKCLVSGDIRVFFHHGFGDIARTCHSLKMSCIWGHSCIFSQWIWGHSMFYMVWQYFKQSHASNLKVAVYSLWCFPERWGILVKRIRNRKLCVFSVRTHLAVMTSAWEHRSKGRVSLFWGRFECACLNWANFSFRDLAQNQLLWKKLLMWIWQEICQK